LWDLREEGEEEKLLKNLQSIFRESMDSVNRSTAFESTQPGVKSPEKSLNQNKRKMNQDNRDGITFSFEEKQISI